MNPLDDLWGATLKSLEFDLVPRRAILHIAALDEGVLRNHELVLEGVSEFRLTNQLDWSYVETTEFYLIGEEDGRSKLDIILWVEDSRLVTVFDRAILDGKRLNLIEGGN